MPDDKWLDLEEGAWENWKPQTYEAKKAVQERKWAMRQAFQAGYESGWNRRNDDAESAQCAAAELLAACQFVWSHIGYLQELWGKEAITNGVAQELSKAISRETDRLAGIRIVEPTVDA